MLNYKPTYPFSHKTYLLLKQIGFVCETKKMLGDILIYDTPKKRYIIYIKDAYFSIVEYLESFTHTKYIDFKNETDILTYINTEFKNTIRKNKIKKIL